jgi:hypothetical protein
MCETKEKKTGGKGFVSQPRVEFEHPKYGHFDQMIQMPIDCSICKIGQHTLVPYGPVKFQLFTISMAFLMHLLLIQNWTFLSPYCQWLTELE